MNSQTSKSEPDPDAIKMFVGQIPRSMDENDLRKMFEEFGPVFQLNILRDKVTCQSKGCCFVTFYTRKAALDAQNALHNIKTMPGMQHPIQMKPADSEKRNVEERKLFIGMLSKKCNENDVRMMFAPFGQIEECTVLREQNGQSKGCAFVTYASRQCAQNAIKAMHHSQTMEGCRFPLVAKFADTQKEKEMKKLQQIQSNLLSNMLLQQTASGGGLGSLGSLGNSSSLGLNTLQVQQILAAAASAAAALQSNPGDVTNLQNIQNLQSLATLANLAQNSGVQSLATLNQLAAASNSASPAITANALGLNTSGSVTGTSSSNSVTGMGGLGLPGMTGAGVTGNMNGLNSSSALGTNSQTSIDALSQAYSGMQQYAGLSGLLGQASFPNAFAPHTTTLPQATAGNTPAGKQTEGPEGANLFIYHLPQEFSDHDLMQMFAPFGSVVSAKVFIDKQTNLSKCFGFVSYDNPVSASAAIQAMNGFQIGMKRLKVQLKRPKSDSKPY